MSSYSPKELALLKFTSVIAADDFLLILPFIRKECGNVRTVNAYRSRYYEVARGNIQVELNGSTDLERFNNLNIQNPLLKKLLKPETRFEVEILVDKSTQTEPKELVMQNCGFTIEPVKNKSKSIGVQAKNEKKEIAIQTKDEVEIKQEMLDEAIKEEEKHDYMEHPVINYGNVDINERPPLPPKPEMPPLEKDYCRSPPRKKRKLNDGSAIEVPSHTDSNKTYIIKKYPETNTIFCSCPAWKYQKKVGCVRTCKHIIRLEGWDNEVKRITQNKTFLTNKVTKKGIPYKI